MLENAHTEAFVYVLASYLPASIDCFQQFWITQQHFFSANHLLQVGVAKQKPDYRRCLVVLARERRTFPP